MTKQVARWLTALCKTAFHSHAELEHREATDLVRLELDYLPRDIDQRDCCRLFASR